jgi:hypothetical protein
MVYSLSFFLVPTWSEIYVNIYLCVISFLYIVYDHVQIDDHQYYTCLSSRLVFYTHNLFVQQMPVGIEAWITQIPPITRGWLALSILISLAVVGLFWCSGFDAHL